MNYDLFISYSRRDDTQGRIKELVEQIQADYRAFTGKEDLRVFFDTREISGMDDWRHRILDGLRESHLLLACLSPAYMESPYCVWEFTEYLKHELGRALIGEGIAPIYFVEVPGWNDADFEKTAAAWITELRRRQHFDLRPWQQDGVAALKEQAVKTRMDELNAQLRDRLGRFRKAENAKGNVDRHNERFVGRVTELRRLREMVGLGRLGCLTAVQGLGGMGKTALAVEYAHAYAHEYVGGRWQVRCEGRDDLRLALISLAGTRDLAFEFTEDEAKNTDRGFERVLRELKDRADAAESGRVLLILDNVDNPTLLEPAQTSRLPAEDWLHVLITTRLGHTELTEIEEDSFLPIDELKEEDALELIERHQPNRRFKDDVEKNAAREIVRLLGCFTLAVEGAAVFLGQYRNITCTGFLERLKKEGLTGLETAATQAGKGIRHNEKRLSVTLPPMLERLSEQEKLVLTYAALLPADCIAVPWLRALAAEQFPELSQDAEPGYPDPWQDLVRKLFSLRLLQATAVVDKNGEPLVARMHRLVQELVIKTAKYPANKLHNQIIEHADSRCEFLAEGWLDWQNRWEIEPLNGLAQQLIKNNDPEHAVLFFSLGALFLVFARFSEAEPLLRRALEVLEQYCEEDPDIISNCLSTLAGLLQATNRLPEAEPLLRRALDIVVQKFGIDHPDLLPSLTALALLLQNTDKFAEAEALMRRALAICKNYNVDHTYIFTSLNNLANLLKVTNRLAEAEPLMRKALEFSEECFGPDHPSFGVALSSLAQLLQDTNRLAEAEPLMRRALLIAERNFGPEHPSLTSSLSNLARLLKDIDRFEEAEPLLRRALAINEQIFGPDHSNVAAALNKLALFLLNTTQSAEAELLLRRALAINEQIFGPDHSNVATDLNNLALFLQNANRFAEAEPLLRRALIIYEQSYGPDHTKVATSLNNLGSLLKDTNRLAEAEPLLRRALAIDEQSYGPDHPDVARDLGNLASLLYATNRLEEAEPLMRKALAINEQIHGPDNTSVATGLYNLASLLNETNRCDEAALLIRRVLAIDEHNFGPDHPNVAYRLNNLALLLQSTNQYAEAELLMRRALAIDEKNFGPDHPAVATHLSNLASLLQDTSRFEEAEPLIRRALAIDEQSFGPDHPEVATRLNNLALLLQATNRLEEAEPLQRRALAIDEQSYGPDHPKVAICLSNLASLLQDTDRLAEAEPLSRQALSIYFHFTKSTGHTHPSLIDTIKKHRELLKKIGQSPEETQAEINTVARPFGIQFNEDYQMEFLPE